VPEGAGLHPRSGAIVTDLARNVRTVKVNAAVTGEVPTVYVASTTDPIYTILMSGRTERVRVPAGARPGSGADRPLVILNPEHPDHGAKVELRVWQASVDHANRRITGNGAGLFRYNNDGARLNPDGTRSLSVAFRGFGTGSGLSYMAGLVRPGEVAGGEIRHAIRVAWGCNDFTDAHRAPAIRTDQSSTRCNGSATAAQAKVDMGMRMRLDPAVNCEARRAPVLPGRSESTRETAFVRTLCRALQRYGLVVLDGTGNDGLVIYMEDEITARWSQAAGSTHYGGFGYAVRDASTPSDGFSRTGEHGIPWSRMQVID
jgi:hypothetical protein